MPRGSLATPLLVGFLLGGCHLVFQYAGAGAAADAPAPLADHAAGDAARDAAQDVPLVPADVGAADQPRDLQRAADVARVCTFSDFAAPTLVPNVNTPSDQWSPAPSPDDKELFFSTWLSNAVQNDVFVAVRPAAGRPFQDPQPVPLLTGPQDDDGAELSADGLTLYFSSDRAGGLGGNDLWSLVRATPGGPFTAPAIPVAGVNSAATEWEPSITADGLELYFSSYRSGGKGGLDLWVARRSSPTAPFGAPAPLASLSSPANDLMGDVSADGLELFFSSTRPGGLGMYDLYRATRPSRGASFSPPEHLAALSTPRDDVYAALSGDGSALYHVRGADLTGGTAGVHADLWVATRACR